MRALFVLPFLAACASTDLAGTYEGVQAAAGAGSRHVRVTLNPDGSAAVSSAYSARPSRFLVEGTWRAEGNVITVKLDRGDLVFRRAGDYLLPTAWDPKAWSEAGPGELARVR
ncbi:MAG TPA: hypothetical protein VJ690_10975 [Burkholderiales bacterium]|nr:hypothetical protein [Burkholderiales bacterium]